MRTAIVGTGRMGRRHVQVVRDLNLDLVGICDQSSEALRLIEKEYDVPPAKHFTDISTLLTHTNPECVIIATTAPTHCDYTLRAVEAGVRYILCEKPMGISIAECDRMLAACKQHGAKLSVNHQMRFMEQYIEPNRIVYSDVFGGLSSVTVVAGNFGMAMNGTHYIEMFRYMADEEPIEVTAWFSETTLTNPRGPQFGDRAGQMRLTTASGKRFYMEIGEDQGHGMLVVYTGPYGRLIVDELGGKMILTVREEQHRALPTTRYGMPWIETERKIEPADAVAPTRSVLRSLLDEKDYPTGEDGRLAVAALVAAYVSNENGHVPTRIGSDLPVNRIFPWA